MATKCKLTMQFVPMSTINKKKTKLENNCSDWVATEKIHGASFQFFTNDGQTVYLGSRRRHLDCQGSFQKCNLKEFHQRHLDYVIRLYNAVETEERWQIYRTKTDMVDDEEEEEALEEEGPYEDEEEYEKNKDENVTAVDENKNAPEKTIVKNETEENIELRIYGELYGGGGVNKDMKSAIQKEIIYADEFRFYVFGININRKWTTVAEMNDLCKSAGFPFFAAPVCPPKPTIEDLTTWLTTSGFMKSKSKMTDKMDDVKTMIEGVVMMPLRREDFRLHAVKLLASAFIDVRRTGNGKTQTLNYCTKARYLSVISKLDIPEREDVDLVTNMFIADIIEEAGETEATEKKKKAWTKCVRTWLTSDGYIQETVGQRRDCKRGDREENDNRRQRKDKCNEDDNDEEEDGIGNLFG